jgi:hypothetical protein
MDVSIKFPTTKPSKIRIQRICQIDYAITKLRDDGLMDVQSFNNYEPRSDTNPYHWRTVPSFYSRILLRALYRLEMLKIAAKDTKAEGGHPLHIEKAQFYLLYMDLVLDAFWDDAFDAQSSGEMKSDWRSDNFDQWVRIEFNIHRHSNLDIDEWLKLDASNIDLMSTATEDLSKFVTYYNHTYIYSFRLGHIRQGSSWMV